jgi:hypothetical protein
MSSIATEGPRAERRAKDGRIRSPPSGRGGRTSPGRLCGFACAKGISRKVFPMGVRRVFAIACASLIFLAGVSASPVHATVGALKWDEDGEAEVEAPPFVFSFSFENINKPSEIRQDQVVRLGVSVTPNSSVCEATLLVTPTLDGSPSGSAMVLIDGDYDYFDDEVTVRFPVRSRGAYGINIEGSFNGGGPSCWSEIGAPEPYAASIELFTLTKAPPKPESTKKVSITSTGPRTLVANTRGRSPSIRITFTVKDPDKRKLLHSICMKDTYDCWFEDSAMAPRSFMRKTPTGWIRTWDFYWERASPSSCLSYYWNQPDVSVILVVSNADGKVVGRKKHTVKLTCR